MSSQHLLCTLCRALFESAEQLEAVSAVRQYENLQREGSQAAAVGLLQTVVYDAGHQCAPQVASHVCGSACNNSCIVVQQVWRVVTAPPA